jgi:predicted DNA-binding transcriptional regulator YafY
MARGDQLIRQWKLLHTLEVRGGRTTGDLMQEMACSRRTLWRDLAVLQKGGFPIASEQDGRERRYRLIGPPRGAPPGPFTLTELMSLHLGRHLLVPLRGMPAGETIHTALEKVSAALGPAARNFLTSLGESISARTVQAKDHAHASETLRMLQQALQERRTLEAKYHSFGRDTVSSRRLDPLHLWHQQGGIYLAAYCHTRRQVLTFALERFRHVRLTDDIFEAPREFNLDRYLEGSFGIFRGEPVRVALRFSRAVARYVAERQWHPSQTVSLLLTGELEMALKVPLSPELRRWILGYGKDVEVLEPRSLREDIRREWLAALRGREGRVAAVKFRAPGRTGWGSRGSRASKQERLRRQLPRMAPKATPRA